MSGVLGHNIRTIRNLHGWTQAEVAQALDVSPSYVYRVESGELAEPSEAFIRGFTAHFRLKDGILDGPRLDVERVRVEKV